ncbi:MAG: PKD domain-containing protein [Methanosarcinaceae archaeon]|nr:PKD domain-containing protein [Methanosarcinaceae archaeon]
MRAKATIPGTVKLSTPFTNSENATAIALAAILLFALIVTVYTVIQVEYVPEWKTDAEYAHMNEVWADMGTVKSSIDSLIVLMGSDNSTAEAGISISVPLSMGGGEIPVVGTLKSGGTLAVNEIPHTVEIKIITDSDDYPENFTDPYNYIYDCGTVTFHSNNRYYVDQVFWYENGALIFEQDDRNLMKFQPSFINFNRNAENEYVYINPVEILGNPNSISGNIRGSLKLSANSYAPELNYTTHENISINISTKYPLAWENYFKLTAKNAGLSLNENYTLSSTEESVNFTYLAGNHTNVHIRNATIKAEIVVGGEGSTAWELWEYDEVLPVADFTFNVSEGYAPLTVNFTDHSKNANNWSWDFGDGSPLNNTKNPIHTFVNPGTYTVNLTARNENGTDTETTTITVLGIIANFTTNVTNGTAPLTVQFNDTSTGNPISWFWDFGDGKYSTEQNLTHIYNTTGIYIVNLTVSKGNDTDSKSATITVSEIIVNFTTNVTNGTAPLTVQFTDQSQNVSIWNWNFGDGSPLNYTKNPIHTFVNPGTYTVNLTASNGNVTDSKSATITVTYPIIYPVANFNANETNGPVPLTVQFTDNSTGNPTSWFWDLGDGNTSTERNLTHTYHTAGNYTVNLTVSNGNGADSYFKVISAGVLLTGEWYTYNNASVTGDATIDVGALQDYDPIIEGYFEPGGGEINVLIDDYEPVNYTESVLVENQDVYVLDFSFVNFYETGSNVSDVTILIVYAYDSTKKHGSSTPMPEIVITLQDQVLTTINQNELEDEKWYVFRDTLHFEEPPTAEDITSQLKVNINGVSREGVFLIDYIGVYLGGEG